MLTDVLRSTLRMDLKQLHKDGICHIDIKLDNLLFDQVRQKIRWIDFSSATMWDTKGVLQDRLCLELLLDNISEVCCYSNIDATANEKTNRNDMNSKVSGLMIFLLDDHFVTNSAK